MTMERKDWALVVVAVLVAGVCTRLGFWQLDRLSQRRARNAVTAAALAREPLVVGETFSLDSVARRRIRASGVYDYARERVRPGRFYDGTPGVAVLTPLRLADGRAVFVDRGWAPSPDARRIDLLDYRERDTVEIVGLGVLLPRGPGDVDAARLADSLPYALLPFGIQQLPSETPARLRRWPASRLDNGPHLGYAVQWFSLAMIAVVGTAVLLKTSRKSVTGRRQGEP
jgi:surfeit locus 1 family protein